MKNRPMSRYTHPGGIDNPSSREIGWVRSLHSPVEGTTEFRLPYKRATELNDYPTAYPDIIRRRIPSQMGG